MSVKHCDSANIGVLVTLPRELRVKIYGQYFAETYLVYGTKFWVLSCQSTNVGYSVHDQSDDEETDALSEEYSDVDEEIEDGGQFDNEDISKSYNSITPVFPHLSLLLVSKAVNGEAAEVLYTQKTFRLANNMAWPVADIFSPPISDRLMNVEICLDMWRVSRAITQNKWGFSFLGNKRALRRSFRIKLWSCSAEAFEMPTQAFINSFKRLSNFSFVIIEIDSFYRSRQPPLDWFETYYLRQGVTLGGHISPKIQRNGMPAYGRGLKADNDCPAAVAWMDQMKTALEPALGPGTREAVCGSHYVICACSLKFQPQKHIARKEE